MTRIHLIYPHGNRISCPDAIGRHLGKHLKERYDVVYHDWDKPAIIRPGPNDILLGHANPSPFTCFRMSLGQPGWKRILLMTPYTHGDTRYNAFIDSFIDQCDEYLTITGNYWFSLIDRSIYAHWLPKMKHVDLAVDQKDFPLLKDHFNQIGKRRFVFIGKSGPTKNVRYLQQIGKFFQSGMMGWIGRGRRIRYFNSHGYQDFSTLEGRSIVCNYDFLLTVSRADANPATILEAMSWGLIPVCTPESGYIDFPGIINIPLDNPDRAVNLLNQLQTIPETQLRKMQLDNLLWIKQHFNWSRFSKQVIESIENPETKEVGLVPLGKRLKIKWKATIAPYTTWC